MAADPLDGCAFDVVDFLLGGFHALASSDRNRKGETLFLQQLLYGVRVVQAFDDLIPEVVLSTVIVAKLTGLGKLAEATEKIVECFSELLLTLPKVSSLDCDVDLSFHMMLECLNDGSWVIFLAFGQAKVVDRG